MNTEVRKLKSTPTANRVCVFAASYMKNPASFVMFGDSFIKYTGYPEAATASVCVTTGPSDQFHMVHNDRCNQAFFDGHAASISGGDFLNNCRKCEMINEGGTSVTSTGVYFFAQDGKTIVHY